MREELEKILLDLGRFCKKYNKEHISIAFIDNYLMSNPIIKDKDYDKLNIFYNFEDLESRGR